MTKVGDIIERNGHELVCVEVKETKHCGVYNVRFEPYPQPISKIRMRALVEIPKRKSPLWQKMRKLAVERDRHKCSRCGETKFLDVHHKDRNRENNSLENLITLCIVCHAKEHKHYEKVVAYTLKARERHFGKAKSGTSKT